MAEDLDWAAAARALAGEPLDALQEAVALADGDGTVVAASVWMEVMFGYGPGELPGLHAESLVPDGLLAQQRDHRAARMRSPGNRPADAGPGLAGLRKDGTMFPVRVSLTPVTTAAGQFTLAVIRDAAAAHRPGDLAAPARQAAAARQEHLELMDSVIAGLFHAGLTLQSALDLPPDAARQRTREALDDLDGIIRQVRGAALVSQWRQQDGGQLGQEHPSKVRAADRHNRCLARTGPRQYPMA